MIKLKEFTDRESEFYKGISGKARIGYVPIDKETYPLVVYNDNDDDEELMFIDDGDCGWIRPATDLEIILMKLSKVNLRNLNQLTLLGFKKCC